MISQFVDPVLADKLWSRVCHLVPSFKGLGAVGLNQHMRFLKYGKGHFFAPHQDGENRHGAARSLLSALLYLSGVDSNESGGGTRFISPECPEVARTGRCDRACDHCVDAPVAAGCLLVFAQSLVHAGTEPMSSDKFATWHMQSTFNVESITSLTKISNQQPPMPTGERLDVRGQVPPG